MVTKSTSSSISRILPLIAIPPRSFGASSARRIGGAANQLTPGHRLRGRSTLRTIHRQGHSEAAPLPQPALYLQGPAVHLDYTIGDGEPQAGSLPNFLGCEEGQEQLPEILLGDPASRIGHGYPDRPASIRQAAGEGKLTSIRHRLRSVDDYIGEYPPQLTGVRHDRRYGKVQMPDDGHPLEAGQLVHLGNDLLK